MLNSGLKWKYDKLRDYLKKMKNVVIAYSGGVDSSLLLKVAKDVLGENVLAVTAVSEIHPEWEYKSAKKLAKELNVKHMIIRTDELSDERFLSNPPDRCYYCKRELFTKLRKIAKARNMDHIIDGGNYDDLKDFRPGLRASKEFGVKSPLVECKLTKCEIRKLSKYLGLKTWNKLTTVCFASRIPYGEEISREKLRMISNAEKYLLHLGFKCVRVRHYGNTARIEVSPNEINMLCKMRKKIVEKFKRIGYRYITLDLQGYRPGSMNEPLPREVVKDVYAYRTRKKKI